MLDLSNATPADLNQFRDLSLDERLAWNQYRVLCEYIRGAETAIRAGEKDPAKVRAAMYQFHQFAPQSKTHRRIKAADFVLLSTG